MAHILVIDDEPHICRILSEFLTRYGHTVDTATGGRTGVKLSERQHYDLVITDIFMPEMDGLEVIVEINRNSPATRVIAMSGGATRIDKNYILNTAHAMGACKVIPKPLDLKGLQATLAELTLTTDKDSRPCTAPGTKGEMTL